MYGWVNTFMLILMISYKTRMFIDKCNENNISHLRTYVYIAVSYVAYMPKVKCLSVLKLTCPCFSMCCIDNFSACSTYVTCIYMLHTCGIELIADLYRIINHLGGDLQQCGCLYKPTSGVQWTPEHS